MIEFLFLDLDDTILDFHKAERIAIAKTIQDFASLLLSIFQECGLGRVVAGIKIKLSWPD